jgi:hypothetical protein
MNGRCCFEGRLRPKFRAEDDRSVRDFNRGSSDLSCKVVVQAGAGRGLPLDFLKDRGSANAQILLPRSELLPVILD